MITIVCLSYLSSTTNMAVITACSLFIFCIYFDILFYLYIFCVYFIYIESYFNNVIFVHEIFL